MKLTPLQDRIIACRRNPDKQTPGGLVIPETATEKPMEATVMAVGEGKILDGKRVPMSIKTGDAILLTKYAGNEVTIDGEEYVIVREDDVLAIVGR